MSRKLKEEIINILHYRFNLDDDKANEDEIKESLLKNIEFRGTNLWALIFAIFIASIGLNVNSAAVIIGAMLISPLMGPIMGIGLGAGIFDFKLIRYSLKNLLVAVVISVATSAIYFWLTPLKTAQSELLARTSPTIWDVLIALFGGLAGIVASSRKNISNSIPGVAIATALMPPLCTAGYGLGTGNIYYFIGAFYLFVINSVCISISTFLIIRFLKFEPVDFINKATEVKVRRYIWWIAILTILPSLYLAYNFVQQEIFKQNLRAFLHEVVEANNYYVINEKVKPAKQQVSWLVYGEKPLDSLRRIINSRQSQYGLANTEFTLRQTLNASAKVLDNTLIKDESSKIIESRTAMLVEKDNIIRGLEARLKQRQKADTNVYREFVSLFGEVQTFGVQKAALWNQDLRRDSVLLVFVKKKGRFNVRQAQKWLQTRFYNDSVVLAVE